MLEDYPKEIELRDGENVIIRIAQHEDETSLVLFFLSIPENQRDFIPYDLAEQENLVGWFGGPNWEEAFPLVAEVGGRIVGVGLLKGYRVQWRQHVGDCWMIVHENMRGLGLGRILASELFSMAHELGMYKLKAELRGDAHSALKVLLALGYIQEGVLTEYIRDNEGHFHDISILSCDLPEYFRRLKEAKPAEPVKLAETNS